MRSNRRTGGTVRVLTIETSTPSEEVAVVDDGAVLASERRVAGRGQADELLAAVSSVLETSGTPLERLDAIAVSIGPGRFTGLRVGLSTAKGLAAASGVPVLPAPTLEALAGSGGVFDGLVCPMLDARRGEVYAGLFLGSGGHARILPDAALSPEALNERVTKSAAGESVLFLGTGVAVYRDLVGTVLGDRAAFPSPEIDAPSPAAVAEAAFEAARRLTGDHHETPTDLDSLEPVYLRGL